MLASAFTNPVIVALAVGLPASLVAVLGFVRGRKGDEVAAQAMTVQTTAGSLEGMSKLVVSLQTDYERLRVLNEEQAAALKACGALKDAALRGWAESDAQMAELRRLAQPGR